MKLTGGFWHVEWFSWFRFNGRLLGPVCFWMKSTVYSSGQYDSTQSSEQWDCRTLALTSKSWHGTVHKSVVLSLPTDLIGGFTVHEFCAGELISNSRCFISCINLPVMSRALELSTCAWSWHPGHGHDPRRLCVERQRDDAEYQLSRYWYHSSLGQRSFVWWWCLWNQRLCREWLQEIISEQWRIWDSADTVGCWVVIWWVLGLICIISGFWIRCSF